MKSIVAVVLLALAVCVSSTQFFFNFSDPGNYSNVTLVLQRGDSINATDRAFSVYDNGTLVFNTTTITNITILNLSNTSMVINNSYNYSYYYFANSTNATTCAAPFAGLNIEQKIDCGATYIYNNVTTGININVRALPVGTKSVEKDLPVTQCYNFSGCYSDSIVCAVGVKETVFQGPDNKTSFCMSEQSNICPYYCKLNGMDVNTTGQTPTPTPVLVETCGTGLVYDSATRQCIAPPSTFLGLSLFQTIILIGAAALLFIVWQRSNKASKPLGVV